MTIDCETTEDEKIGMSWWNGLSERARALWLQRADSAVPADAWAMFKAEPGIAFEIGVQEGKELAQGNDMTLRRKIENAVMAAMKANPGDAKAITLAACAAFEWEVELGGNGWWDDDEEFVEYRKQWRPASSSHPWL